MDNTSGILSMTEPHIRGQACTLYLVALPLQMALVVKTPLANAGDIRDVDLILGLGRSPGVGKGNPLQYSCLGNPMDSGAWQAIVRGVAQSWTRLSN